MRPRAIIVTACLAFLSLACAASPPQTNSKSQPKNIILFVADGAGVTHFTLARQYAHFLGQQNGLFLDAYHVGSVRTHSAKERVTDSASSATAYATGVKTYNGAIGVDAQKRPMQTVLEVAEDRGMATGLVATSRITHATPASFSAHVESRSMEAEIAAAQITQDIDVMLGGGAKYFLPESEGGVRSDGRNLLDEAAGMGYRIVSGPQELESLTKSPVIGLLAPDHLPYEIDVDTEAHVTVADLTRKAIELLESDEEGFFLLVEGSRIDHASHDNDAAAAIHEVLAYDEAFRVAVDFARQDGETLVVAVSDHETGGLSVGRANPPEKAPDGGYRAPTYWKSLHGESHYSWYPSVIQQVEHSVWVITEALNDEGAVPGKVMQDLAGIDELTADELEAIETGKLGGGLHRVVSEIISRRAHLGWTTYGHTAEDVNLYVFGPGSEPLLGNIENHALGLHLLRLLGADAAPLAGTSVDS